MSSSRSLWRSLALHSDVPGARLPFPPSHRGPLTCTRVVGELSRTLSPSPREVAFFRDAPSNVIPTGARGDHSLDRPRPNRHGKHKILASAPRWSCVSPSSHRRNALPLMQQKLPPRLQSSPLQR